MTVITNTQAAFGKVQKYSPLGAHLTQFCDSINALAYKIYLSGSQTVTFFSNFGEKLGLVSVVFVPLRIYNIVQIVKSTDRVKRKAVDITIEVGGIFNAGVVLVNFLRKNIKEVAPALPYLVGVSAIFQAVDVYKKSRLLRRTRQEISKLENNDQFSLFYERIKEKKLSDNDRRILQASYRFDADAISKFSEEVAKIDDPEKVRNLLREKIRRGLISQKVLLTASTIEFLTSSLILTSFFVSPPAAAALGVTNACIFGSTSSLKIAVFIFDQKTKKLVT